MATKNTYTGEAAIDSQYFSARAPDSLTGIVYMQCCQPMWVHVFNSLNPCSTAAGYPGAVLETIKDSSSLPEANFTQGILTSRQAQAPAGIGTIIHTAQIGHGNSGGPLVDAGGCAVGVNSWLNVDAEQER